MERFTIRSTHKLVSVALALLMLCSSRVNAGSFSASGSTLTLDLDVASQLVRVVATSTTYTFSLTGGATNTWSGTTSTSVSVSGATLTVTATGRSTFSTIIITDSQTGNAVTFNTSGSDVYADHITITLDNTPGAVTFNGSSSFSGSNALSVTTSGYISFASGASLSTVDGSLTLEANMQATSRDFAFSGIMVNNATVQITGTGVLTMRGKGGSSGSKTSFQNKGIAVITGGQVIGGTTGTTTIEGRGYTGVNGTIQGQGVFVYSAADATTVSRISSNGSNVSVTGYGSNTTGAPGAGGELEFNAGVVLGGPSSSATTQGGIISAGGSGTVTITGYGGTTANPAGVLDTYAIGVYLSGSATSITSGGGAVSVTGTGGGADSLSTGDNGVYVFHGSISAGTNGNVTVTGTGGPGKGLVGGLPKGGVMIRGDGSIKAGIGTGSTLVTGYGGGQFKDAFNCGVTLHGGVIGSDGSGNVTVIGYGGGLNYTGPYGSKNHGIYLYSSGPGVSYSSGSISSNGGDVRVEGTGGGGDTASNNCGISVTGGYTITAGGSGTVTVNGNGGAVATGSRQHGVLVTGTGSKITSGGGNVNINATEGNSSTSYAIALESSGTITTATIGGNITLKGNSFNTAAGCPVSAPSAGSVTFIPLTSSTEVQFTSAADEKGKIYLSTTDLATVTAGDIYIGNASTGLVTVNEAVTPPSGSNLTLSGSGLSPKLSGTEITMSAGKTLSVSGIPSVNIDISGTTVNTQYDQLKVVADLTLTGKTLNLSGAYTPIGGDVFTIVEATSISGTFSGLANGASITFNGKQLTVNYTATQVTLTAACINPTSGGTIAAAQSGNSPFDPVAFTSSAAASGHSGTLEYKWQSSTTSSSTGFSDIASSNTDTYDAGSLTQTTWYKRLARVSCQSNWTGAAESNVLEVTVCGNPTSGGTIAAAQSGNSPFDPVAFTSSAAASGHSGTLEYKWQSSTTSSSAGFSDIASSNAATYNAGALTQTTWYKRLARVSCQSNWTGAAESNVLEVTVCGNPTSGGTIAAAQSGNSPFDPVAFTSSAAASGHSGTLEYKWQSSTTSNTTGFSDIASSNSDVYDPGSLTQTTWYKRLARVSCQSNWTGAAESNVLEVTVASMAAEPTAQPTALYFTTTGTSPTFNLVGRFTAAASSAGYLVVRNTGSAPTFTPADGTAYSAGSQTGGTVVYSGSATDFTESSVTLDLAYHYAAYAFNGSGSTTNYLTTSPLTGMAFARSAASGTLTSSGASSTLGFPGAGATLNFPAGTSGTTLNVTKNNSAPSSNIQVSSSIRGMKPVYFSITSSTASPGGYTLILDFSGLGALTPTQWNSYKITKRANASSPWVDVTTLGATIVNRQTDGVWGKFTITGLSSFSEFGLAEVYDGVVVSNLDQTNAGPSGVSDGNYNGQAFVMDGLRYQLTKVKVSAESANINDLRARLYGSTSGGEVNTSNLLTELTKSATAPSGTVYELTPSTSVKLEPNRQYWIIFYSGNASVIQLHYTSSKSETGPASFPTNLSVASDPTSVVKGSTYLTADGSDPYMFSIEATEVSRTWTGTSTTDWSTAGNWTPSEIPGNGEILTIPNAANDPVLPANTSVAYLTIASGAVLDLADKTLTVTHGFSHDGTLTGTTGKLILASTAAQGIEGTGTIRNLEVNNSAGVAIFAGSHMQTITGKLTPTLGTLTTNGNLTLRSDINGTARVGQGASGGGYITGDVVTQRYLSLNNAGRSGRAWRLVTIPVTGSGILRDVFMAGQSGADLTISTNRDAQPASLGTVVIGHNQPNASTANGLGYDWIGIAGQVSSLRSYQQNAGSGSFASSQVPNLNTTTYSTADEGYMLFARGDRQQDYTIPGRASATVLQATGALKQGTIDVTIPALASAGYVLVGNPYMAVLDLEKVILDNATVIDNTVYVWDANIDGNAFKQGGYRAVTRTTPGTWTITGTSITNPQYIESGSAFFVKPTSSGGTLSIKESHKVDGTPGISPHGAMTDGPSRLFINLEVTDTATRRLVDGAVAFFDTNYKEGLGDAVDIESFANISSGAIGLRQSGQRLAMEGRPWPADSAARSIPVDMRNLGTDAYVLRILATNMSKEGFTAWLKDRHLNKETALKTDDETLYPFRRTGDLGIDSSRFEIVYRLSKPANSGTLTPDDAAGGIAPRLYPNPSKAADVKLSLGSLAPGRYEVQVVDMSGRLVLTKTLEHLSVKGEYRFLQGRKLSLGTYIIRISDMQQQLKETLRLVVE